MNHKITAVPDVTLFQEYVRTLQRSEYFEPEKALLRAILEDAFHCYEKYRTAENRAGRQRFQEVDRWITGAGGDWIFSFDNVCELLGLDPGYVRDRVRKRNEKGRRHQKPPGGPALEMKTA